MGEFILMYVFASIVIAIGAFVFADILTNPGEVFDWLYRMLDFLFRNDIRERNGKGKHPIFKMIIGCHKCVAGQWSLWTGLIFYWRYYSNDCLIFILPHIGFILLSIFMALVVKKIYIKHIR